MILFCGRVECKEVTERSILDLNNNNIIYKSHSLGMYFFNHLHLADDDVTRINVTYNTSLTTHGPNTNLSAIISHLYNCTDNLSLYYFECI